LSAFFPLYPWLASLFHRFAGVEITACLLLVSNLALFLALFFLFRLAEGLYDIAIAKATLVYLIIYPLAYFLHAPYTESLALCLSVLAYLGARQRRWAVAALAGLAAGLTRGTTLPLALAMGWEVWEDYKSNRPTIKMLPVLAWLTPALGTGLFLAWRSAAGFPSYSQILQRYWGRHFSWPWETLYSIFDLILSKYLLLSGWINLLILILALAITIWGVKKLPMGLRIYQVSLLGFMLMNTLQREPLGSFGRYSLLLFPQFILFALWCRTPFRRLAAFTLGVTLQLYLAGQFFMWGWTG
jgi:hypothetical protein